jgi:hypothetical protein
MPLVSAGRRPPKRHRTPRLTPNYRHPEPLIDMAAWDNEAVLPILGHPREKTMNT